MMSLLHLARANRWLLGRRIVQIGLLAAFLSGPVLGFWIVRGTLASSLVLDTVPLTDPLILLQGLAARHWPETTALIGAALVAVFYAIVGGRAYCGWVCPVNMVTDLAGWLRRKLRIPRLITLDRRVRYLVLAGALAASAASGVIAWESVNPVTLVQRGLVTGTLLAGGAATTALVGVFLFDLGVAGHGWCGALCPVGAFYAVLGRKRILRVAAVGKAACDDCGACYAACPEPQLLGGVLRGSEETIKGGLCTACGRCIDVCGRSVFRFGLGGKTGIRPTDHQEGEGAP